MADPTLTDEELAEMEARAKAAAAGPWTVEADDGGYDMHGWRTNTTIRTADPRSPTGWAKYGFNPADAEFIVHARTDVPRLISALRASRAEVKEAWSRGRSCGQAVCESELAASRAEVERLNDLLDQGGR